MSVWWACSGQNRSRINLATEKYATLQNLKFKNATITDLDPESCFDLIYSIEVLEHIVDPMQILDELVSRCKKILLITPNFLSTYNTPERMKEEFGRIEHYHVGFSPDFLARKLDEAGFEPIVAKEIYLPVPRKVRQLFQHIMTEHPTVLDDSKALKLFRALYDEDLNPSANYPPQSGFATLVYAERRLVYANPDIIVR